MEKARITRISELELTMRDVINNMEDFAADFGLCTQAPDCFEILSIEPPRPEPEPPRKAEVIAHPRSRERLATETLSALRKRV